MSDKSKKRVKNKDLVSSFIEKEDEETEEPLNKKNKLIESADDSLKFFKTIKSNARKSTASTFGSTSTMPNLLQKDVKAKGKTKTSRAKKGKQPDIRKALGKQDFMIQNALDESCQQDNVDPFEMQLALAISESLKDQQNANQTCEPSTSSASSSGSKKKKEKLENPFESTGKLRLNAVLAKYGFQRKKSYTEYELEMIANSDPKKRSKFKKFPTKLTSTKPAEREKMTAERIEHVLETSLAFDKSPTNPGRYNYQVYSYYLQELTERSDTLFYKHSLETHSDKMLHDLYVIELFHPSFVNTGHLLKNWNDIYGRDPSPVKEIRPKEDEIMHELDDNKSCSDIFDGVESFSLESPQNPLDEVDAEQGSPLDNHLCVINGKLSQDSQGNESEKQQQLKQEEIDCSTAEVSPPNDSGKIETVSIKSSGDESTVEYSIEEGDFHNKDLIDLTQHHFEEEPAEDDHIDLTQQGTEEDQKRSIVDEIDLTQQIACGDDDFSSRNSQISMSDEVIDISDEEINYSVHAANQNSQVPTANDDVLEIDNAVEQSLMDLMCGENNDGDSSKINEEVNATLNDSCAEKASYTKNQLSSSIMEILNKYKDEKNNEAIVCAEDEMMEVDEGFDLEKPSTSSYHGLSGSQRFDDDKKADTPTDSSISEILKKYSMPQKENREVFIAQNIDIDNEMDQDMLSQNSPCVRKSLDNILNSSLTKSAKKKSKQKPRKKSLGIDLNDKYTIDTESNYMEPYFSSMTPVELKRELYKYGVRTLPVKKAVELLTHIYEQTHPTIRVKAVEEVDQNDSRIDMNLTDMVTNIGIKSGADDFVFQMDSNGILEGEEYILPKIKKSKTSSCAIPLHISFYNMVRSNEQIQRFILEFRPLDLDEIYRHFRKFNLSYQLADIIAFLDKRCITFKTKEQSCSKRHQKKKKKPSQQS